MKAVILFTTRPITSKYTKSLIQQMSILQDFMETHKIIFVTPKSDNRNRTYIEDVAGIRIDKVISYKDHYHEVVFPKAYSTWLEYIENETIFTEENLGDVEVEHVFVFGGLLSDATAMNRKKNGMKKIMNTWQQMNFTANGTYISGFMQLIRLSRETDAVFHEICYDPCENSVDQFEYKPYKYYCYHGYDWPDYNLKRLDSLQYFLETKNNFFEEEKEKTFDLCFGFTALTKDREKQYDDITSSLENEKNITSKIYVRHKALDIDTFVNRDMYLDTVERSKFTLIIPPYDPNHFSIYRFIESINLNCLPLITGDVNVSDFSTSFELDDNILKEIIIEYNEIGNRISNITEERRVYLLNYFKDKCLQVKKNIIKE